MRDAFLFRHSCWFLAGAAFVTPRRGKGHYTSCMYNDRYLLICIAACGWLIVALAGADIGASMVTNVRKEIGRLINLGASFIYQPRMPTARLKLD